QAGRGEGHRGPLEEESGPRRRPALAGLPAGYAPLLLRGSGADEEGALLGPARRIAAGSIDGGDRTLCPRDAGPAARGPVLLAGGPVSPLPGPPARARVGVLRRQRTRSSVPGRRICKVRPESLNSLARVDKGCCFGRSGDG